MNHMEKPSEAFPKKTWFINIIYPVYFFTAWTSIILISIICVSFASVFLILFPGSRINHLVMKTWALLILLACGVRVKVRGLENIDKETVQIFASNHSSHADIFVLCAVIPVKFFWIAKKMAFSIPFIGWFMKKQGFIFVDSARSRDVIDHAVNRIENNGSIVIFPEGKMSADGKLQRFKPGICHIAARTGAPVTPVVIRNSHRILRAGSYRIMPGTIYVSVDKPIYVDSESLSDKTYVELIRNYFLV